MADCWICEEPEAEDVTSGGYDGKQLRCRKCGRYDVAGSAILRLAALTPTEKSSALAKAKRFAKEAVPTISSMSF